jgi:hypothetical protein
VPDDLVDVIRTADGDGSLLIFPRERGTEAECGRIRETNPERAQADTLWSAPLYDPFLADAMAIRAGALDVNDAHAYGSGLCHRTLLDKNLLWNWGRIKAIFGAASEWMPITMPFGN